MKTQKFTIEITSDHEFSTDRIRMLFFDYCKRYAFLNKPDRIRVEKFEITKEPENNGDGIDYFSVKNEKCTYCTGDLNAPFPCGSMEYCCGLPAKAKLFLYGADT